MRLVMKTCSVITRIYLLTFLFRVHQMLLLALVPHSQQAGNCLRCCQRTMMVIMMVIMTVFNCGNNSNSRSMLLINTVIEL